jgi:hypothetical protein
VPSRAVLPVAIFESTATERVYIGRATKMEKTPMQSKLVASVLWLDVKRSDIFSGIYNFQPHKNE